MVAGVALIILIGAGAVGAVYGSDIVNWLRFGEKSSARQEKSLETIATLPVSEMYAEAQDRIAAGELNMALVILEGAAQRDHARSATAIGEMYDPARWGEIPSPRYPARCGTTRASPRRRGQTSLYALVLVS